MLYLRHNFADNYNQAVLSKDTDMVADLLCGEIAKILVSNRSQVIKTLKEAGYKVSEYSTNKQIAKLIHKELQRDDKLATRLKNLIVKFTQAETQHYNFNFCGDGTKTIAVLENPEYHFRLKNGIFDSFRNADGISREKFFNAISMNETLQNKPTISPKYKTIKIVGYSALALLVVAGVVGAIKYYRGKSMGVSDNSGNEAQPITPTATTTVTTTTPVQTAPSIDNNF